MGVMPTLANTLKTAPAGTASLSRYLHGEGPRSQAVRVARVLSLGKPTSSWEPMAQAIREQEFPGQLPTHPKPGPWGYNSSLGLMRQPAANAPSDNLTLSPAMSQRHEYEHALQSRPERPTEMFSGFFSGRRGYTGNPLFQESPEIQSAAREIPPSLSDVVHTSELFSQVTGRPLRSDVQLTPNTPGREPVVQNLNWLRRQGGEHGLYSGQPGTSMTEQLATPSGQAYLKRLLEASTPLDKGGSARSMSMLKSAKFDSNYLTWPLVGGLAGAGLGAITGHAGARFGVLGSNAAQELAMLNGMTGSMAGLLGANTLHNARREGAAEYRKLRSKPRRTAQEELNFKVLHDFARGGELEKGAIASMLKSANPGLEPVSGNPHTDAAMANMIRMFLLSGALGGLGRTAVGMRDFWHRNVDEPRHAPPRHAVIPLPYSVPEKVACAGCPNCECNKPSLDSTDERVKTEIHPDRITPVLGGAGDENAPNIPAEGNLAVKAARALQLMKEAEEGIIDRIAHGITSTFPALRHEPLSAASSPSQWDMPWFVAGAPLALAGGAMAGWHGMDKLLHKTKDQEEESELAHAKQRFENALLAQTNKTAAYHGLDELAEKAEAGGFEKQAMDPLHRLLGLYGLMALGSGLVTGNMAYNAFSSAGPDKAVEEALKRRRMMLHQAAPRPFVAKPVAVPVEEDEDELD